MAKSALTDEQKNRIAQLASDGISQSKIADLYNVSQGTISNALRDKKHEAEIDRLNQMMQNAMAYGAKAAFENGDFVKTNKLIEG